MPAYESQGEMQANLFVGEYSLLCVGSASSLDVPVVMVEGRHEARDGLGLAGEWYDALQATENQRFDFLRAGHRPHFEHPAMFAEVMAEVLATTR